MYLEQQRQTQTSDTNVHANQPTAFWLSQKLNHFLSAVLMPIRWLDNSHEGRNKSRSTIGLSGQGAVKISKHKHWKWWPHYLLSMSCNFSRHGRGHSWKNDPRASIPGRIISSQICWLQCAAIEYTGHLRCRDCCHLLWHLYVPCTRWNARLVGYCRYKIIALISQCLGLGVRRGDLFFLLSAFCVHRLYPWIGLISECR
jgi:hypothetical protein